MVHTRVYVLARYFGNLHINYQDNGGMEAIVIILGLGFRVVFALGFRF